MEYKLTKIDPHNCSIEELKEEIDKIEAIKEEYFNLEQSIKIFMNSSYGATGSPWFVGYNVNIAEAITLQGQDVAKYASACIDEYFFEYWHNDTELHKILGLTHVNKINEKSLTIYMDTDSCYVTFQPVIQSCNYQGNITEFILKIKDNRLNIFLRKKFEEYAKRFNTKNLQELELEKISYSAIIVAKKKYILDMAWKEPNVFINPQEQIKSVGIEIVQGQTPKFARKVLREMIRIVCEGGKKLQYADIVKKLKKYKEEYLLQSPEDIAKTQAIGDYEKYCLEDKKQIKLASKCPQNVRAAAVHNYKLYNSNLRTKYDIIKTGDKLKHYYTSDENEVFGFLPGNFPYEFASPVNYDLQFERTIINPFNRILESIGFNPIPGNLIYAKSLF